MKTNEKTPDQFNQMVLVPQQMLESIQKGQQKIMECLKNLKFDKTPEGVIASKYIPETVAMERIGRKTTWFYNMRKNGKLNPKKIGSANYYDIDELDGLLFDENEE